MIIDMDWGDGAVDEVMSPFVEYAKQIKDVINEACKKSSKDMAERQKSLQEYFLGVNGNIASMKLIRSITFKEADVGENAYLIGPNVAHFYPLCIEYGRGPVYPINAKYLHYFTLSGVEIFSKYSSPTEPSPFVEPSFEEIVSEAEDIVRGNFS